MAICSSLKLFNYRSYSEARIEMLKAGLIVLTGDNGAGKTNVLEALSLISPGKGLRGARMMDIQSHNAGEPWAVATIIETRFGPVQIGTGLEAVSEKRVVRINGETMRGQNALSEHLACVWLTPQMDRLFLDSSRERRRFLDRLVFGFDPGHSGRVTRYENAMAQRSKLLREQKHEPAWLDSLEGQMAESGVAIAAARLDFAERLQAACDQDQNPCFPKARLSAQGTLDQLLKNAPALEVEALFQYQLKESRGVDMLTGGAATGPHKSDLQVWMADKNMPADQCSTGEQKALLIGLILAHARLIAAERGVPPLLLLDEVVAHLDEGRRAALFQVLTDLGGQVWLTGTDQSLFSGITKQPQFFSVKAGQIEKN